MAAPDPATSTNLNVFSVWKHGPHLCTGVRVNNHILRRPGKIYKGLQAVNEKPHSGWVPHYRVTDF